MGKLLQFQNKIGHPTHGFGLIPDPKGHRYNGFHLHPAAAIDPATLPQRTRNAKVAPPIWNQGQTGCHDDKTQVLTDRGWIDWSQYDGISLLGTVNPTTKTLEFQAPLAIQRYEHKGPLYKIDHDSLDFALTPNHRMLRRKWSESRRTLEENFAFCPVEDLGWYSGLLASPIGHCGLELDGLTVGKRSYSGDDLLALISLIVSDGWVGGTNDNRNTVSFCCFREDRMAMVSEFAHKMGLHSMPSRPNVWAWADPELAKWLKANIYVGDELRSPYKRIPDLVRCASQRQIVHFLKFYGDQHVNRLTGQQSFFTSSSYLADDLQDLHLRIGKRTGLQPIEPRDALMKDGRQILAENCQVAYALNVWQTDQLSIERKRQVCVEEYAGTVYCATVPNSTLITRRNGKVLISGNSCFGHGMAGQITTTLAAHGRALPSPISPNFVYKVTRAIDREHPAIALTDVGSQPNSGTRALALWGADIESEVDGGRTATSPDYTSFLEAHVNDEPKLGDMERAGKRILAGFNAVADDDPQKLLKLRQALASGHTFGTGIDAGGDAFQRADGRQSLGFCGPDPDHWIHIVDYAYVGQLRKDGDLPATMASLSDTTCLWDLLNSWGFLWPAYTLAGRIWVTDDFVLRGCFGTLVTNLGI
jgi:hypothetical protein